MTNTANHKQEDIWRIWIMSNKTVELTNQEMWRLLDAISSYKKDYALAGSVTKTLDNVAKKLKKAVDN